MDITNDFLDRKIDYDKLIDYGFIKYKNDYILKKDLDTGFEIEIKFSDKTIFVKIFDKETELEYLPFYVKESKGEVAGLLKEKYQVLIDDIINNCTSLDIFKEDNSLKLIEYVKEKYDIDLELLFKKSPKGAVFRVNDKWFGLLMKIKASLLDLESDSLIEILNIPYNKAKIDNYIDYNKIFPAYHMNKNSWISVRLDKISFDELSDLIDNSYKLVLGTGLTKSEMERKVYSFLEKIPYGKVSTYKDIALYLGDKNLARVVGSILKDGSRSDLPYYKIVASNGSLIDSSYKKIQRKLLEKEGIVVNDKDKVDLKKYKWENI